MYVPAHHEEADLSVLHALIKAHPLGAWVIAGDDGLVANHIPFLIDPAAGPFGTLIGHVARANPVWRSFSAETPSLIIFQGAETYITPSWYPSKQAHGRAVPTWNYAVVHAHGLPRAIEDRDWLRTHVTRLTNTHEANKAQPWKVTDAPADFTTRLLDAIVGIEIPITKLVGKWKTSQNRPEADKLGVIEGLTARDETDAREMAALVAQSLSGKS
jgi:transcriptional regulator